MPYKNKFSPRFLISDLCHFHHLLFYDLIRFDICDSSRVYT